MVDHEFFLSGQPVPDPIKRPYSDTSLNNFSDSDTNVLGTMKLFRGLEEADHREMVQQTVDRYVAARASLLLNTVEGTASTNFEACPVVWDTGASFGLTPFATDFIDYEEVDIPVKDIAHTNTVVGMGTVMWKFRDSTGELIYLPLLCYHLPTADIRLLSPQTYHQLHGGHSSLDNRGTTVVMHLPSKGRGHPGRKINIPIDLRGTNLPVIFDVSCNEQHKRVGREQLRSSLARHAMDFNGSWEEAQQSLQLRSIGADRNWNKDREEFEYEFKAMEAMVCPCVGDDANSNLTGPQRELLLWHWRLGCSMKRVQQLMVEHEAVDTSDESVIFPQVIKPRFKSSSSCPIPLCTACELARAKKRNPKVIQQKAIEEKEGILAANKYCAGDFVSMDQFVCRTSGRLPTGYGREGPTNRYHGGIIFNDAATGIIWVENQVSLGAAETLMSKERFEQWLYELACVEIKHYRSDNGVFTAEEFREECVKLNQGQSFSGVGAQHQNSRAERSIQTIMYMARTFMLHVSLHWSASHVDDLSLWPFAVKHAVWLYNRLPNRVTGLTPIERLTNTKTDHRDLLRSHVWGCPTYVLDAKLQNDQKIPKWNRRSRQGQFLGYSDEHSSMCANIRHLKTGFVSPQYHCVFDDLFQTVYSNNDSEELVNAITNLLWENEREVYAEDEFDNDGMLVYKPPPLDKVWLDEPERRKRRDRLQEQRGRTVERQKVDQQRIIDKVPPLSSTPGRRRSSSPPALIRSSSSDSSDSMHSQSSADSSPLRVDQESEGEIIPSRRVIQPLPRANSPLPNVVENDDPSTASEGAPEGANGNNNSDSSLDNEPVARRTRNQRPNTTANDSGWDRGDDGRLRRRYNFASMSQQQFLQVKSTMSRTDRRLYYTSLSVESQPPRVATLTRKKRSHRQRLAYRREAGDAALSAMNFSSSDNEPLTVEALLNSSIAPFIELAANDCGYKGSVTELICNHVHPLFLKAKSAASKEDNPNWFEAMKGAFADEYWKAAVTELETLESMGAWDIVDESEAEGHVIDSTWAFKLKRFPDGLVKKFKARFCARGDQQKEGIDFFETYAPVVQWTTVRLMLILEVLLDLKSKQGDVTAAFLHADLGKEEKVYVRMPMGFRKQGKVLKLKKTLYGLRQSPRAFWKYMVDKMELCDMPQSKLDPCLFVGKKVICICYVDDLLFWARDEKDIHDLAIKLREQGVDLEQEDDAAGFLGVRLERDPQTGLMEMTQSGLIDRVIEALGLDVGMVNGKATPAEHAPLVKDVDGIQARKLFSYSSVVGMLLYLAGHSRPDIAYAVNCSARYMFNPMRSHEEALKRIGRYLKATRTRGLILNPVVTSDGSVDVLQINCYPDADFAGLYGHEENQDPASVKSRTGFVITVADCAVLWQSKLQTTTALSTMEAEINALAHSCRELFPVMDMVEELGPAVGIPTGPTTMNVSIHEDNAGALVLAQTLPPQFTPRSKHYALKTVWFREQIVLRGIKLLKIDTLEQLGDMFTKGLGKVPFEHLRKKLMGW